MNIPLDPSQGAAYLLFALISPIIVALVKQDGFSQSVNSLIALVLYGVFAAVGAVLSNIPIDAQHLVPLFVVMAVTGRMAYSTFWSQIGGDAAGSGSIDDKLTKATSVVK